MVKYDKNGNCERCGLPGSGFVSDGVCMCVDSYPNHEPGCICKKCEDLWDEIEASGQAYARYDYGYDRN